MSEVIQDMELGTTSRGPYGILDHALRLGIFTTGSVISYSDHQIRIIVRQKLDSCFQLISNILVQRRQVSLNSSLMKNGQYIVINSFQLRKNLYRSFIKTSFEQTIKILINQQGRLKVKMHTFLTTQVQFRQTKQTSRIYKFIQKLYTEMMEKFATLFQKLKVLIQPVYEKTICANQDRLQKLDIIKNTCRFLYVKPSFMVCDGERGKKNHNNLAQQFIPENQLDLTNIFELKVQSEKTVDNKKYYFFIELWQASLHLQKVEDTSLYSNFNLVKIKEMYKASLKIPDSKSSKGAQTQQILSQIHISDIQRTSWSKIYEGGFGYLYKANLSFHFVKQKVEGKKKFLHEKSMQRVIVMKTDKINNAKVSRIQLQKLILKALKGKRSRYLPIFYQSTQQIPKHQNYILTDFFPMKSLDNWFKNYGQFVSLFTKITFIMYICYGIYFLHQNNIVHRDLKIANILIDTKMVTKIIDFGESYHPTIQSYLKSKGKDCKPGYTLPYSPPQVFGKSQENTKKFTYDIFSLGFIIYQIIFGKTLLADINQVQLKKIYIQQGLRIDSKYTQQSGRIASLIKQKIYLASQFLQYYGPTQMLTPILNVIERCLDPKIENRPYLQWVMVIIRETYTNLLDFYSL